VHARYDPALGRFTDFRLTSGHTAEAVAQTRIGPGRTMVLDRGYGRVRNVADVLAAGSDVITRIGWRAMALLDASGQRIDLLSLLPVGLEACEHEVHLAGIGRPLRLVLQRLPPERAVAQRKRTTRRAGKRGQALDPRTLAAAEYLILLTSLPTADASVDRVIALYRARWQVELGFKRLKSLGGLDKLAASDPRSARTWLLAHLIAAVLTEDLASRIAGFSPQENDTPTPPQRRRASGHRTSGHRASLWRAWQIARRAILQAILPPPPRVTARRIRAWQQQLRDPPRIRPSQANSIAEA
jgi:hypothetical protein